MDQFLDTITIYINSLFHGVVTVAIPNTDEYNTISQMYQESGKEFDVIKGYALFSSPADKNGLFMQIANQIGQFLITIIDKEVAQTTLIPNVVIFIKDLDSHPFLGADDRLYDLFTCRFGISKVKKDQ